MSETIRTISIEGFRSIRSLRDFELKPINLLIGPNGAGKSNFISFFKFLRAIIEERLQFFLQRGGGADTLLFLGPKFTEQIKVSIRFGQNGYDFTLVPAVDGKLVFAEEKTLFTSWKGTAQRTIASGNLEARLPSMKDASGENSDHGVPYYVHQSVSAWVAYHFHDTGEFAGVRRYGSVVDNMILRPDASNLAAYLYRVQSTHPDAYRKIVAVVGLAAPFFHDFALRPNPLNPEQIQLEWRQFGTDMPFLPSQMSDGTLRFICLATALLQPDLPRTLIFDEPELGLHPLALTLLARMLKDATAPHGSDMNQVVVSTQSALLLNEFAPQDVVVVDRADSGSTFKRLDPADLSVWLEEYSLGEIWQKNLLGGRPQPELFQRPVERGA